jgi:hypothetical protein
MPTATTARRMFELLEPVCLVTFMADECNEEGSVTKSVTR